MIFMIINSLISLCFLVFLIYLTVLLVKALRKYLKSGDMRKETAVVRKSLGDTLRFYRLKCNMTQEFVAEYVGVSRQSVSKWENGVSEPSTSNLIAIAKLYNVPVEEILRGIEQ